MAAVNPSPSSSTIIGIDLGTTYSCVAVFRPETGQGVEIIPGESGNRTTPSFVAFTDNERLMGEAAKAQAVSNASNTVYDAKRLIGRSWAEAESDIRSFPFKVVEENEKLLIKVVWRGEEKKFAPEEISAMLLKKLRDDASKYLGFPVTEAVITVPAYFNDNQRSQTKLAGTIAGLNVRRVINEPTAAAIAYGLDKKPTAGGAKGDKAQTVLIFDLGGGTFDVSLLQMQDGIFEVKATSGDTHLGGEDFDHACLAFLEKEFRRLHKLDINGQPRATRRLLNAIEKAKRVLSSSSTASVQVDSLYEGVDFEYSMTRAKFEELNQTNFKRLLKPVEQVLADSKLKKTDVDEVVLVGGSTRIPKVQQMLQDFFGGKELNKSINPDEAVAYGAAVQGAILAGKGGATCQDLLLLDVTPLSLGIETVGGVMSVVVKRNTPIPTKKTEEFTTEEDYQTEVDIDVYEGERPQTKNNHLLGKFVLTNIPPAKRGIPKIDVTFDIDANGILNVAAVDRLSGTSGRITITNKSRNSDDEVKRMVSDAEKYQKEDAEVQAKNDLKNEISEYLYSIKDAADNLEEKMAKLSLGSEMKELVSLIDETLEWLEDSASSAVTVEEMNEKKRIVSDKWNPLIEKSYA